MRPSFSNRESRGFVLITVLVVLGVVGLLSLLLTTESALEVRSITSEADRAEALYVAEAGYHHALWSAERSDCALYPDFSGAAFGDHSYSVDVSPSAGSPVTVAATGRTASGAVATFERADVPILDMAGVQTVVLQPDAAAGEDAWIYQWRPLNNYGNAPGLSVEYYWADSIARGLLRFDVSEIPAAARIVSAILELNAIGPSESGGPVTINRLTAAWDEAAVTWSQRRSGQPWTTSGGDFDPEVLATTDVGAGASGRHEWDVTDLVQGWVEGRYANHGLLLRVGAFGKGTEFDSSDSSSATARPRLTIVYACECGGGEGGTATLQPGPSDGRDAWMSEGKPDWNYGAAATLPVSANATQRSVLAFDVSGLPPDALVRSARLELYATGIHASGAGDVYLHAITDAWGEGSCLGSGCMADGVTWNSKDGVVPWTSPGVDHEPAPAAVTYVDAAGVWHAWDVTEAVTRWVATGTNHGLLLKGLFGGADVDFASSDHSDPTLHPRLVIDYQCRCGVCADAPPSCSGDYVPTTETGSWSYGSGADFRDMHGLTWVPEGFELDGVAAPEGGGWVSVDWSDTRLTLYDLAGTVLGQTLTMPSGSLNGIAWIESGTYAGWLAVVKAGASEDLLYLVDPTDTVSPVEIDIGGFASQPSGIAFIAASASGLYDEHLAITDSISDEIYIVDQSGTLVDTIAPTGGVGALQGIVHLRGTDRFLTVDDGDDLARIVDLSGAVPSSYALSPFVTDRARAVAIEPGSCDHVIANNAGAASGNPDEVVSLNQGAGGGPPGLLFVVGNSSGLTSAEIAHQTLVESWGYVVDLVDDGASQSEFDAALANNDVVFLTNDVTASNVGSKLTNASIGVVTSEDNLSDELGLASTIGWESGTALGIVDNTHSITSPFALGPLTVLSSAESFAYVTGALAPDLSALASSASGFAVVSLDAGATTWDGGTAAGRRVQLPWGGMGFDPSSLTSDGETLLQRALEWGSGVGPDGGGSGPACDATVADDFETGDYTGSTGSLAWSGPWLEINESDGPNPGDEIVAVDVGDRSLRVRDNDGGGEGVERRADLSGYTAGELRLALRRDGLDTASDYVTIEAWNPGTSSWDELGRAETPPGTDADYQPRSFDLSTYLGTDTRIRFLSSSTLGGADEVWFDDVEICVRN